MLLFFRSLHASTNKKTQIQEMKSNTKFCRFFTISDSTKFSKIEKNKKLYTKPCFFYTKINKSHNSKNKINKYLTIIYFTNTFANKLKVHYNKMHYIMQCTFSENINLFFLSFQSLKVQTNTAEIEAYVAKLQ